MYDSCCYPSSTRSLSHWSLYNRKNQWLTVSYFANLWMFSDLRIRNTSRFAGKKHFEFEYNHNWPVLLEKFILINFLVQRLLWGIRACTRKIWSHNCQVYSFERYSTLWRIYVRDTLLSTFCKLPINFTQCMWWNLYHLNWKTLWYRVVRVSIKSAMK